MRVVAFATRQDEKYTKGVMLDMEYDPQPPYKAGSVRNTDNMVVDMMLEMYDMGLQQKIKGNKFNPACQYCGVARLKMKTFSTYTLEFSTMIANR